LRLNAEAGRGQLNMIEDIQLPTVRTVRMKLVDMDPVHDSTQEIKVMVTPFGVSIFAEGFGGLTSGGKAPVLVSQSKGKLIVSIWIGDEPNEPTHRIVLDAFKGTAEIR
jgi:hypothetical protein